MTMTSTNGLQVTTPSDREIRIERSFAAPRRLLYDAYTKPELVKRWLGAMPGWSWAACEMDVRAGGRYHWRWKGPDGAEMGITGTYREIIEHERLVNTEQFDPAWYPGEAIGTVVFTERGGRTTVTTNLLYESKQARDAVVESGATGGMEQGYKVLDTVLDEVLASEQTA